MYDTCDARLVFSCRRYWAGAHSREGGDASDMAASGSRPTQNDGGLLGGAAQGATDEDGISDVALKVRNVENHKVGMAIATAKNESLA